MSAEPHELIQDFLKLHGDSGHDWEVSRRTGIAHSFFGAHEIRLCPLEGEESVLFFWAGPNKGESFRRKYETVPRGKRIDSIANFLEKAVSNG